MHLALVGSWARLATEMGSLMVPTLIEPTRDEMKVLRSLGFPFSRDQVKPPEKRR